MECVTQRIDGPEPSWLAQIVGNEECGRGDTEMRAVVALAEKVETAEEFQEVAAKAIRVEADSTTDPKARMFLIRAARIVEGIR